MMMALSASAAVRASRRRSRRIVSSSSSSSTLFYLKKHGRTALTDNCSLVGGCTTSRCTPTPSTTTRRALSHLLSTTTCSTAPQQDEIPLEQGSIKFSPSAASRFSSSSAFSDSSSSSSSSSSSLFRVSSSPNTVWRSMTRRLLEEDEQHHHPAFDSSSSSASSSHSASALHELDQCLRWWARQRPITSESIDKVWKLWNVLLLRLRQQQQLNAENKNATTTTTNTNSLLNLVLDHWRLGIMAGVRCSSNYSVDAVWARMRNNHPGDLLPYADTKSFALLLSAVGSQQQQQQQQQHYQRYQQRPLPYLANEILDFALSSLNQSSSSTPAPPTAAAASQPQVLWNSTILAWAKSVDPSVACNASDQALELLSRMKQLQVTPNEITYATVLQAISNTAEATTMTTTTRAERTAAATRRRSQQLHTVTNTSTVSSSSSSSSLLEQKYELLSNKALELLDEMRNSGVPPNAVCYLHALQTLVRCQRLDLAHDLLQERIQEYLVVAAAANNEGTKEQVLPTGVVKPTTPMFGAVMTGYARQGNIQQVLSLWQTLQQLYEEEELTVSTLNFVLQALAESKTVECAQKAQDILEAVCAANSVVDTASYNTVLHAWAEFVQHKDPQNCVERAEALLMQIPHPNTISYTSTIKAWARSDLPQAAERCLAFLEVMWESHECNLSEKQTLAASSVKPNAITYSTVLYAWSRSQRFDAPVEAEKIFADMMDRYKNGDSDMQPNEASYVALMTTWNRSSSRKKAATRIQFYFEQWKGFCLAKNLPLSSKVYHAVLLSKRRLGDGYHAERLLEQMWQDYRRNKNSSARPTGFAFRMVMSAHASSSHSKAAERVQKLLKQMEELAKRGFEDSKPKTADYTMMLAALARSNRRDAAERAMALLAKMQSSNDLDVNPDASCYSAVLAAWSGSRHERAPEITQAFFDGMFSKYQNGDESCEPSSEDCLRLLSTWSGSSRPEAAPKALEILNEMEDRHLQDPRQVLPDCIHFSTVIDAFANRGDIENAHALLERLGHRKDIMEPHVDCFNGVLKAILKSRVADSGERAEALLRRMPPSGPGRPNKYSYTFCINSWGEQQSNSSDPDNALERAESLLGELVQLATSDDSEDPRLQPNPMTFRAYLRVLSRSSVSDKQERADRMMTRMNELGVTLSQEDLEEVNLLRLDNSSSTTVQE